MFGWGKKNDDDYEEVTIDGEDEDKEESRMPQKKMFGKGGVIDFSTSQEDRNGIAWGRLVELGLATEAAQECIEEYPDDPDYPKLYNEVAVAEAAYASRPWWQKVF